MNAAADPMDVGEVADPMDVGEAAEPMDVDDGAGVLGRVARNHAHTQYTTDEIKEDRRNGVTGLEDFSPAEYRLAHMRKLPQPPNQIDPAVLKSYNIKMRARNASYLLKATRPWRLR